MIPILGHDEQADRFARTVGCGRLASTYLFVGPHGIGKRLFAERLAAALLCQRRGASSLAACGACDSCRLTEADSHPDLLRVARPEGKTTLPLDLFLGPADKRNREGLCHDLGLRPAVADRRVAIIDDADHFSIEAANCLLKTLEEPPPRSLLILVGTSLSRQLSTIRSRSQVVRFQPLADRLVAEILRRDPHAIERERALELAGAARGSVARALELAAGELDEACEAVRACLNAQRIDPIALATTLESQSKAVGTEPRVRRRALAAMFAAAIEHYHRGLLNSPNSAEQSLLLLDVWIKAEEALVRNANQSAVIQWLAERVVRVSA